MDKMQGEIIMEPVLQLLKDGDFAETLYW